MLDRLPRRYLFIALPFVLLLLGILWSAGTRRASVVPSNSTVFTRGVPFTDFVAHVIYDGEKVRLEQRYRLYDEDWRDGIWSRRIWDSDPMDAIHFRLSETSHEKHGILVRRVEKRRMAWMITWFVPFDAVAFPSGRVEWDMSKSPSEPLSDDTPLEPSLRTYLGEISIR
ncbi:MAG: hypothetical protein WCL32_06360 [Planctomycetota bacterium]